MKNNQRRLITITATLAVVCSSCARIPAADKEVIINEGSGTDSSVPLPVMHKDSKAAEATDGNDTENRTEITPPAASPISTAEEGKSEIYSYFLELPHLEMPFVDDTTYKILMNAYDKIDYTGEFEKGDLSVYNKYRENFYELIQSEVSYTEREPSAYRTDKMLFVKDLPLSGEKKEDYIYHFFDMDSDGTPELCVDIFPSEYIFKYIPESDEFILWFNASAYEILGTRKLGWLHLGSGTGYGFYKLTADGSTEYSTFCYAAGKYSEGPVFVINMPHYYIDNKNYTEEIKELQKTGYQDSIGNYFFRVTEEQWHELTQKYLEASNLAEERIKEVTYTYDELLGELDS